MKSASIPLSSNSADDISCASVLKVLADETRLAVVECLLAKPLTVAEMNESLGVEPTLLSHHLKTLREANLITRERRGRFLVYSLTSSLRARSRGRVIDLGCCKISFS